MNTNEKYYDLPLYNECFVGGGCGWSKSGPTIVTIDGLRVYESENYGDSDVYFQAWFDPTTWQVFDENQCFVDGLIYLDKNFLASLRTNLIRLGFTAEVLAEINYSEQGAQTETYVHLHCMHPKFMEQYKAAQEFLREVLRKDGDKFDF